MIMMAVKIALSERKELMACETIEIDGLLQKANNIHTWALAGKPSEVKRLDILLGAWIEASFLTPRALCWRRASLEKFLVWLNMLNNKDILYQRMEEEEQFMF